jgi:hypothetical protein
MTKPHDGWEVDQWRNSIKSGVVIGWPPALYCGAWSSEDGLWKKRKQRLIRCVPCGIDLSQGPDWWNWCPHIQPVRER